MHVPEERCSGLLEERWGWWGVFLESQEQTGEEMANQERVEKRMEGRVAAAGGKRNIKVRWKGEKGRGVIHPGGCCSSLGAPDQPLMGCQVQQPSRVDRLERSSMLMLLMLTSKTGKVCPRSTGTINMCGVC